MMSWNKAVGAAETKGGDGRRGEAVAKSIATESKIVLSALRYVGFA